MGDYALVVGVLSFSNNCGVRGATIQLLNYLGMLARDNAVVLQDHRTDMQIVTVTIDVQFFVWLLANTIIIRGSITRRRKITSHNNTN